MNTRKRMWKRMRKKVRKRIRKRQKKIWIRNKEIKDKIRKRTREKRKWMNERLKTKSERELERKESEWMRDLEKENEWERGNNAMERLKYKNRKCFREFRVFKLSETETKLINSSYKNQYSLPPCNMFL